MRLDKFVVKSSELNPAQAQQAIIDQRLRVNGEIVCQPRQQVHENNVVELACPQHQSWQRLTPRPSRYLMLHKTAGTQCSHSNEPYPSIFAQLEIERCDDLHLAGRLDVDTTGLVIITDDGRWSFDIIRPQTRCEKVYRVTLRDQPEDDYAQRLAHGLKLQGEEKPTLPARYEIPDPQQPRQVLLTICEGRYHQVKRMFAALGNRVQQLHRQQVGALELDIEPGQWRHLSAAEVASFLCHDLALASAAPGQQGR